VRILGVDPGSRKTGFGVIDVDVISGRFRLVEHGIWYLESCGELPQRLARLSLELDGIIARAAPTHAAIEDVFLGPNPRSALILGQARGVVLATLARAQVFIQSILPREVKQLATGFGAAQKHQIGAMVKTVLELAEEPAEDAADALAIAMAFATKTRSMNAFGNHNMPKIKRSSKKQRDKALLALSGR
jgi:crossover junction endodeoxyribonuclease RuvC